MERSIPGFSNKFIFVCWAAFLLTDVVSSKQRFREVPRSVIVPEGLTVVLRCSVDGQMGNAQWTKDGFALGFERHVPGYPRYEYRGNNRAGEHHLIIAGIALEDDGEYQCQIGPTDNEGPIWAAANVTVLIAPTSIAIVGYEDGSEVKVASETPFAMECLIQKARPPPTATWYKDGIRIDRSQQKDWTETGGRHKVVDLRSKLTITPSPSENGRQYSCRGNHIALNDSITALVATVTLLVLSPPNSPKITGYNGETLASGEVLYLTCRSEGGVPAPEVIWYQKGKVLDDSWVLEVGATTNDCNLTVSSAEDGAAVECWVTNEVIRAPLKASVTLSVQYPPSGLIIKAPPVASIGQKMDLKCSSQPSKPAVSLGWTVQNKRLVANAWDSSKDVTGGWMTTSLLEYEVTEGDAGSGSHIRVICESTTQNSSEVISKEIVIDIVRPPEPPVLGDIKSEIEKGSRVPLSCYARGGHPSPTLQLFKRDHLLPARTRYHDNLTEAYSEITANESDNGESITCTLTHPSLNRSKEVSRPLNVIFPPWNVTVTASPTTFEVGEQVELVCVASPSNPSATLSWHSGQEQLSGTPQSISEHNGRTNEKSRLTMVAATSDNGRIVTCRGSNGLNPPAEAAITLQVLHAPFWVSKPPETLDVLEGDDIAIEAIASANPPPIRYEWRKNETGLNHFEAALRLTNVTRMDSGLYLVSATNARGSIGTNFTMNVFYPPEFRESTWDYRPISGESLNVTCSAVGNPPPRLILTSSHSGEILSVEESSVTLSIPRVSAGHSQELLCSASNGIGNPAERTINIFVQHGAILLGNSGMSWVADETDALVLCHARAQPKPRFLWSSPTRVLEGNKHLYLPPSEAPILVDRLSLWVSLINISDYELNEEVRCHAENHLGHDLAKIRLNDEADLGKLMVINSTESSATLYINFGVAERYDASPRFALAFISLYDHNVTIFKVSRDSIFTVEGLMSNGPYIVTLYAADENWQISLVEHSVLLTLRGRESKPGTFRRLNESEGPDTLVTFWGRRVTNLIFLITTLSGIGLLLANVAIIACYLRRQKRPTSLIGDIINAEKFREGLESPPYELSLKNNNSGSFDGYLKNSRSLDGYLKNSGSLDGYLKNSVTDLLSDKIHDNKTVDDEAFISTKGRMSSTKENHSVGQTNFAIPNCITSKSGHLYTSHARISPLKTSKAPFLLNCESPVNNHIKTISPPLQLRSSSPLLHQQRKLEEINYKWGTSMKPSFRITGNSEDYPLKEESLQSFPTLYNGGRLPWENSYFSLPVRKTIKKQNWRTQTGEFHNPKSSYQKRYSTLNPAHLQDFYSKFPEDYSCEYNCQANDYNIYGKGYHSNELYYCEQCSLVNKRLKYHSFDELRRQENNSIRNVKLRGNTNVECEAWRSGNRFTD